MELKHGIKKQFDSTLRMLHHAIEQCPDELWNDQSYFNKTWHIAYHTLFFADLYSQKSKDEFVAWVKDKDGYWDLGCDEGKLVIKPEDAYPKVEVLEYFNLIKSKFDARIDETDLEAESGFHWIPFNKFELMLHNLKHIQHHTGQLYERLRVNKIPVEWVRREPD